MEDKWILAKERLPDYMYEKFQNKPRRAKFIVCLKNGNVLPARFNFFSYKNDVQNYFSPMNYNRILKDVVYWMPLPDPP